MITQNNLSIKCNKIDHYTLIVPDAQHVSNFHKNILGYPFLQKKDVNAGSVPQGQFDMTNYIHEWPDGSGRILVITEGLTDESIFRRFMAKYGQGIHHVALQVDDLEIACDILHKKGIKLTSKNIMIDFLSGLKQIFLDNTDTGVFIELIERKKSDQFEMDATKKGFFTHDNMAGLAGTMSDYVQGIAKVENFKKESDGIGLVGELSDVTLTEFVLEVPTPEKTASFFEEVFGFTRAANNSENEIRIFLAAEPSLSFLCTKKTTTLINHKLVCHATLPDNFQKNLTKQSNDNITLSEKYLHIGAALAGYPLDIAYA